MSYVTLTESNVITKLSGPEIAAMKTAALQAAQTNPLTDIISQVVKEIRGYVSACQRNVLGEGETIPDELVGAAVSRIRFELATRLPVASLLTEDRRSANASAITLLRDVAACHFLIVPPTVVATQQAAGSSVEVASKTCRKASREKLSGL